MTSTVPVYPCPKCGQEFIGRDMVPHLKTCEGTPPVPDTPADLTPAADAAPQPAEVPHMGTDVPESLNQYHDRCDRCGAMAYVKTQHPTGELLWCGHHYAEHEEPLRAFVVLDEREKLGVQIVSSY